MKKIIAILLAVMVLFSLLSGCGKNEQLPEEEMQETIAPESEVPVVDPDAGNEPALMPGEDETPEVMPEVTPEVETPSVTPDAETPVIKPETPEAPVTGGETIGKDLSAIVDEMYQIYNPILPAGTIPVDLADEFSLSSYTGLNDASLVKEAIASESMIGAQAYSVVLVRLNNAADAKAVAETMRNGIDQRKWICVMADDIRVVAAGDIVMLCMIDSSLDVKVDAMVETFGKVVGVPFSVDIH